MHNPNNAEILLTVVIPAYNVGPYIRDCIQSVTRQISPTQMVKIIIVVDGATDDTLNVAEETASECTPPVSIIVQGNGGLSEARNTGLRATLTEYVTFLDGDDIWCPSFLTTIMPILTNRVYDLVEYDARMIDQFGQALEILKIAFADPGTTRDISCCDFLKYFRCYSWARVYRTELARRKPFPRGQRFEDAATTPWYYWYSHRTLSLGFPLIGYRQRPLSILKTPSFEDVESLVATTADAASMYLQTTGSSYWQLVAHRVFQQACRRLTWQPILTWNGGLQAAHASIVNVPPPPGFLRWLQMHATYLYTALLLIKRKIRQD